MTPQLLGAPTLLRYPLYGLGADQPAPVPPSQLKLWWEANKTAVCGTLAIASMAASTYHGYRRNKSIWWALVWGFAAGIFPVVTPAIAVAQGFAKPKAS